MWHNNGFGSNGQFPNNFNNQDDFPPSPFAASSSPAANGYFPLLLPVVQYEEANGTQFNDFQPEVGPFNKDAFMQNQQIMSADVQFSPPAFNIPQANTIHRPALDARAAELRERLMRGKEARGSSATPPVAKAIKQNTQARGPSPSAALPKPLLKAPENPAQDLHELISSISDNMLPHNETAKQFNDTSSSRPPTTLRIPTGPSTLAKSQELSLGSPTKVSKLSTNANMAGNNLTSNIGSRHASRHGSLSDMSEGEIVEEPVPKKVKQPLPEEKKTQQVQAVVESSELVRRKSRDEDLPKPQIRDQREESGSHKAPPSNPKALIQRIHENHDDRREDHRPERRDSFDTRSEKRPFYPEPRYERNPYPEPDSRIYLRRNSRDEEYRRPETKIEQKREEKQLEPRERTPTLEQLLPHDRDVKEWLEITGYHNVEYRNKILNRRRQIASLDAQRERLLAEMAAEERGGMQPPPAPQKLGGVELSSTPAIIAGEAQRDLLVSNKRSYSDIQDSRDEFGIDKMPRYEDRVRVKDEDRRPRSRGESVNHSFSDRRDDRDITYNRFEDRRPRRSQSREREDSPGRRAFENRPAAHTRSFDNDDMREYEGPRGYVGYNPNYQGRGRGRGRGGGNRGGYQGHNESPFGSRGANGKSFKDPGGFDKGRSGGQ